MGISCVEHIEVHPAGQVIRPKSDRVGPGGHYVINKQGNSPAQYVKYIYPYVCRFRHCVRNRSARIEGVRVILFQQEPLRYFGSGICSNQRGSVYSNGHGCHVEIPVAVKSAQSSSESVPGGIFCS